MKRYSSIALNLNIWPPRMWCGWRHYSDVLGSITHIGPIQVLRMFKQPTPSKGDASE